MTEDHTAEDVVAEFIDRFNARDWDALAELVAPEATAEIGGPVAPGAVVEVLAEMSMERPGLILTQGTLGEGEPVAVAWVANGDEGPWARVGWFAFSFRDGEEFPVVEFIDYGDAEDDEVDLVYQEPDPAEIPEWIDWKEWDEGAPTAEGEEEQTHVVEEEPAEG